MTSPSPSVFSEFLDKPLGCAYAREELVTIKGQIASSSTVHHPDQPKADPPAAARRRLLISDPQGHGLSCDLSCCPVSWGLLAHKANAHATPARLPNPAHRVPTACHVHPPCGRNGMSKRQKARHHTAGRAADGQHIFQNQNAQPVLDGIYCKYCNMLSLREPGEPKGMKSVNLPPL